MVLPYLNDVVFFCACGHLLAAKFFYDAIHHFCHMWTSFILFILGLFHCRASIIHFILFFLLLATWVIAPRALANVFVWPPLSFSLHVFSVDFFFVCPLLFWVLDLSLSISIFFFLFSVISSFLFSVSVFQDILFFLWLFCSVIFFIFLFLLFFNTICSLFYFSLFSEF